MCVATQLFTIAECATHAKFATSLNTVVKHTIKVIAVDGGGGADAEGKLKFQDYACKQAQAQIDFWKECTCIWTCIIIMCM